MKNSESFIKLHNDDITIYNSAMMKHSKEHPDASVGTSDFAGLCAVNPSLAKEIKGTKYDPSGLNRTDTEFKPYWGIYNPALCLSEITLEDLK